MSITVSRCGLEIDGRAYRLISGSFHYWRHDPKLWTPIAEKILEMGFRTICTYIPWQVHEVAPGSFDFEGPKDVGLFLEVMGRAGLKVLVRPGPHINSEMYYFGLPDFVLQRPEIQAITSTGSRAVLPACGKQFPIPSYACEKFYELTERYFEQLFPILAQHKWPKGPVIAFQADNETFYYFRNGTYELDYHPESIALYRRFLRELYHDDIAELSTAYGSKYGSFDEVEPPRRFAPSTRQQLCYYLDWARYKEYQIQWSLGRISAMGRRLGLDGIPCYQNYPCSYCSPVDIAGTEGGPWGIDVAGLDIYEGYETADRCREYVQALHGQSVMPFVPEFGSGVWFDHTSTFLPAEEQFVTLTAFMYGLKAVNFYMVVERERWQGSPITRDNGIRKPYFKFYKRLNEFISRYDLPGMERRVQTAVAVNVDAQRYAAASLEQPPMLLPIPRDAFVLNEPYGVQCGPKRYLNYFQRCLQLLRQHKIPFDITSTSAPLRQLEQYRYLIVPMVDFIGTEAAEKLKAYEQAGGHLMIGPVEPTYDELQQQSQPLSGCRFNLISEKALPTAVRSLQLHRPLGIEAEAVEMELFQRGEQTLMFLRNPTEKLQRVVINFSGSKQFIAALDGPSVGGEGRIAIDMPPYSVRVWEVK